MFRVAVIMGTLWPASYGPVKAEFGFVDLRGPQGHFRSLLCDTVTLPDLELHPNLGTLPVSWRIKVGSVACGWRFSNQFFSAA